MDMIAEVQRPQSELDHVEVKAAKSGTPKGLVRYLPDDALAATNSLTDRPMVKDYRIFVACTSAKVEEA